GPTSPDRHGSGVRFQDPREELVERKPARAEADVLGDVELTSERLDLRAARPIAVNAELEPRYPVAERGDRPHDEIEAVHVVDRSVAFVDAIPYGPLRRGGAHAFES